MIPPLLQPRWRDRQRGRESEFLFALDDGRPFDPVGIATLLAYGGLVGARSLLRDVEAVVVPLDLAPPDPHPDALGDADRADRLWELLCDAVRVASGDHRRVRAALSGGLDSRAIAAAAVTVGAPGLSVGTFGDPDCADLDGARRVAAALGVEHDISRFASDAALWAEGPVWAATDGIGGPATAPGAPTDAAWSERCDVLLSGTSADVIWGDSAASGPSPPSRLLRLGIVAAPEAPFAAPAPNWANPAAWANLHGRQRAVTWLGVRSRLKHTPVAPVVWHPPLLAFGLALGADDRRDRRLVRAMLDRRAPQLRHIPCVKSGWVHDLNRAWRDDPGWGRELDRWTSDDPDEVAAFEVLGLERRAAVAMIEQTRRGKRSRAGFLSRLRALRRWGLQRVR